MIMDIQTAMWYTNEFNFAVYATKIGTSLPFTIIYAVSNVIFLLVLAKPIGKKIERLKAYLKMGQTLIFMKTSINGRRNLKKLNLKIIEN